MTKLSLDEVQHIADLARLSLTTSEMQRYTEQLSAILTYASQLDEVDTAQIPPTLSGLPESPPLRPDEARPGLPASEILANSADTCDGQFKVPPVLGG